MAKVVDTLVEMGFSKEKAELAIQRTGDNVQDAMEWLLSHQDSLDEQPPPPQQQAVAAEETQIVVEPAKEESPKPAEEEPKEEAKSIKCDDCGKLFNTTSEVEFHAAKSGHDNFSESTDEKKPLTDEERKEQLAKIEAKLKQRRMEREMKEREEALERERNRIKSGKEMLEAKKKHDDLEMKKIMEQRKREKEEEKMARQRVKDQIEQDRLARKAKLSGEPVPVVQPQQPQQAPKPLANYDQVKLQIRLTNGSTLTQTFGAKEPLSAVRLYVEMNRTDTPGSFSLITSFPRKVFTADDYDKPLETLGLAPTATLMVAKASS